jgi:hypothetical protein
MKNKKEVITYNKSLAKPLGNFFNDNSTNGSAHGFTTNHAEIAIEREADLRKSDLDSASLINDNRRAISAYLKFANNDKIEKIIKAAADIESYIIMNTAIGKADVKTNIASNTINGKKRTWLVGRVSFPTEDPKNQQLKINIGPIDLENNTFTDKETGEKHPYPGKTLGSIAERIVYKQMIKKLNEKGTIDELIEKLNSLIK